ncbi:MAG: hypothetical protein HYS80_01795 [Candidatus Aenigmarchaeota archaeon]|nr:hypothetical protein [Candidatus Aenigmarchaeota archaeon]
MGKVLLTLFYHPDEEHATRICGELSKENLDGSATPYEYSSPKKRSPDNHLKQKALELGCDQILTIHSDHELVPSSYGLFVFSNEKVLYRRALKELQGRFNVTYGFMKPYTKPVQIDLELSERNTTESSLAIVRELIRTISGL